MATGPAATDLPGALVMPAYGGACLDSLVPALLAPRGERPSWLPTVLGQASQCVLLVLDGLGWSQLAARPHLAPTLAAMAGGPITSVAPTTTATALTSLTTGMAPAAHGIVGYKMAVPGPGGTEVLNVLRWSTRSGDARPFLAPRAAQPVAAFMGRPVPVVSRADFSGSGFSQAHQHGTRETNWSLPSSLPLLVGDLLAKDEDLVYAYYEGVDKIAHIAGLGPLYDAEVRFVDRLVADLIAVLPPGAALAVTSDHGQVQVGDRATPLLPAVAEQCALVSGEARFRWLHALPGCQAGLLDLVRDHYGDHAWIADQDEVVRTGVLGGRLDPLWRSRLGDVVIVPLGDDAYLDPSDTGDARLVCRHGGLSPDEMFVPLLAASG